MSLVPQQKDHSSFVKTVELLTLRRLHTIEIDLLSNIIKAYSLLVYQKLIAPSATFIHALETTLVSKLTQYYENKGSLCQAISALIRLNESSEVYEMK